MTTRQPTHDAIAGRAHELYVERGSRPGHALRDWLDAEAELRGEVPEARDVQPVPCRDRVTQASMESFPASDSPAWRSGVTATA